MQVRAARNRVVAVDIVALDANVSTPVFEKLEAHQRHVDRKHRGGCEAGQAVAAQKRKPKIVRMNCSNNILISDHGILGPVPAEL